MNTSPNTKNYNLLLVDDDTDHAKLISKMLDTAHHPYTLEIATEYDDAIEKIGRNEHAAYLVSVDFNEDKGLEVIWEISGRGCKGPALLISKDDSYEREEEAINLGAMVFLTWSQLQARFLERMIRHAIDRKRQEDNIRNEQEDLIGRMMDIQDTRDRFEAQSAEYVELAEELAIAQVELQKAMDDVTQKNQQLEQLNMEKNRFFSIISHDLRSPFTSLLGFTGIIAAGAGTLKPEQVVDYAVSINESAKRVFALLENLLEWARLQMDQIASEPKELNIDGIVARTVGVLGPVGADKGVAVTAEVPGDLHCFADEHMIDTVIRNLVNNAIKFTPDGGSVTVSGHVEDDRCIITITDTGVGLTPEQIDNLFILGDQNSTPGTKGERGTGLGLLLCRDLLEKNGGTVSVTSEPGKGSTFSVNLPRQ